MKKLLYTAVCALLLCEVVQAQVEDDRLVPTLNKHFIPSSGNLRSSFIRTNLHADLGFGQTSTLKIPGLNIGDYELFAFEGSIFFVDAGVEYQQKFNDWLALYANFKMAGRMGSDMSTILADGVNTISGGEVGWLIRLHETDKFNLSTSVGVSKLKGNFINVAEYFEEIANNNPYPSLTKNIPAMHGAVGLLGAYAFNPTYGFQFETNFIYGESFKREATRGYITAGVLADVDFLPKQHVPIGLVLGYTLSSAPEIVMSDGDYSNIISGKIYYTGADDFDLGLEFNYYNVELKSVEEDPFVSKVILTLKLYF